MRLAYTFLIDATPKLYWEGLVFRRAITEIAGVPPSQVIVHVTPAVPQAVRRAIAGPCTVREVSPAASGPPTANKMGQLCGEWDADAVAFLDADMIVLTPFEAVLDADATDGIAGVPVFGPSPCEAVLRPLYARHPAREGDWIAVTALDGAPFVTHRNHLNGGLYLVPADRIARFGVAWRAAMDRLAPPGAGPAANVGPYADQVAAGLALAALGERARHLPIALNCPPPLARRSAAAAIHDFAKFMPQDRDEHGHLLAMPRIAARPERRSLRTLIDEVNGSALGAAFHAYRRFRYALYDEAFDRAAQLIERAATAPHANEAFVADMRAHLAAYQAMVRRREPARLGGDGDPPAT